MRAIRMARNLTVKTLENATATPPCRFVLAQFQAGVSSRGTDPGAMIAAPNGSGKDRTDQHADLGDGRVRAMRKCIAPPFDGTTRNW